MTPIKYCIYATSRTPKGVFDIAFDIIMERDLKIDNLNKVIKEVLKREPFRNRKYA